MLSSRAGKQKELDAALAYFDNTKLKFVLIAAQGREPTESEMMALLVVRANQPQDDDQEEEAPRTRTRSRSRSEEQEDSPPPRTRTRSRRGRAASADDVPM